MMPGTPHGMVPKAVGRALERPQEDLAIRLAGSPSEALAWLEPQAKEISAMASFWEDDGCIAARLDEVRAG